MHLKSYDTADIEKIVALNIQTFIDSENAKEGQLIGTLVKELLGQTPQESLYCFVAMDDENLIGSIIFTTLTFENNVNAYILSPVAIKTDFQGRGMGQKLINFGLNVLKEQGVELAFTYGDPQYYCKVGFAQITEKIAKAPQKMSQPEGWLAQSLIAESFLPIEGQSSCVKALNKAEYW